MNLGRSECIKMEQDMNNEDRYTPSQRRRPPLVIAIVVGALVIVSAIFMLLAPMLSRPDLRCERASYSVSEDGAVTSCVVANRGRGIAERTFMSVEFLSRISDIRFSPESAGRVVNIASEGYKALLELENIASRGQVTIFLSVERPQDKPFDIRLLDASKKAWEWYPGATP
jgi:hypothetical protein